MNRYIRSEVCCEIMDYFYIVMLQDILTSKLTSIVKKNIHGGTRKTSHLSKYLLDKTRVDTMSIQHS